MTETSDDILSRMTNWLPMAGRHRRSAWGKITNTSLSKVESPMLSAASNWPRPMDCTPPR